MNINVHCETGFCNPPKDEQSFYQMRYDFIVVVTESHQTVSAFSPLFFFCTGSNLSTFETMAFDGFVFVMLTGDQTVHFTSDNLQNKMYSTEEIHPISADYSLKQEYSFFYHAFKNTNKMPFPSREANILRIGYLRNMCEQSHNSICIAT